MRRIAAGVGVKMARHCRCTYRVVTSREHMSIVTVLTIEPFQAQLFVETTPMFTHAGPSSSLTSDCVTDAIEMRSFAWRRSGRASLSSSEDSSSWFE
mmetsp:Transcript_12763/g.34153  ORF Transcript_12763/g.34153 Transcript_12763/m.34153 type:complete len:97 (+) Transcript_12763:113-403(+)